MFFLHCIFYSSQSLSYEALPGKVTAFTGPTVFQSDRPSEDMGYFTRPKLGWSLIAEAVLAKDSALEIGLFYMHKPYLREEGDKRLLQEIQRMYITTGYRHWWCRHFSTGLNLFSSFSMGDFVTLDQSPNLPEDYATSAEEITNYGLDASIRFEHEWDLVNGIALDLRYSYSLTAESGERANHYMVGLYYSRDIEVE